MQTDANLELPVHGQRMCGKGLTSRCRAQGGSLWRAKTAFTGHRPVVLVLLVAALLACSSRPPAPIYDRTANPYRRAAQSDSRIDRPSHYRVRRGDTLYSIAWRYGLDYRTLARWNGIGPPYLIRPEQRLRLDQPRQAAASADSDVVVTPLPQKEPAPPAVATPAAQPAESRGTVDDSPVTPPAAEPKPVAASPTAATGVRRWQWPADGPILSTFASGNASRKGLDLGGELGGEVRAAADGEVVYSGSGLVGYGELIIIKHDQRYLSAYAHNRKRLVAEGDRVKAGQQIAELGQSGTGGPRLHFEIREDGQPVDPQVHLPRR